ncbi:MAG: IPT/TIG domain-containing protein [Deltaproteobacteria bacterium]|nr:IPT/TIG domain-containing protein [Deltaproteobacteria bacterium]
MVRTLVLTFSVLTGCSQTLESPRPAVDGAAPAIVCNDQLFTTVTVSGSRFTPLPTQTLTEDPRLEIPAITLDLVSSLHGGAEDLLPETFGLADDTRWLDRSTMEFDAHPELSLESGVYDLVVTNVDGRSARAQAAFAAAPPPVVESFVPDLVCVDQADIPATVYGQGFLALEGTLPTVTIGDLTLVPDAAVDCVDLVGPVAGQDCDTLQITLPQQSLVVAIHDVSVTSAPTADCTSVEEIRMEVVPPPSLSDIQPLLECTDQEDQRFLLTGESFLVLADGTLPTILLGDYAAPPDEGSMTGCEPLLGPAGGELCTGMTFTLPLDTVPPGVHDVVVTNPPPADCESTEPVEVELVPAPTIASIVEAIECIDQGDQSFVISGTGFVVLEDGTPPTIVLGSTVRSPDALAGCIPLEGPAGGETCTEMQVTLPQDAEPPGVLSVVVYNPAPADCISEEFVQIEIVGQPILDAIEPEVSCVDQSDQVFTLSGSGFLVLEDGTLPTVTVGAWTDSADAAGDCTPLLGPAGGQTCLTLTVTLPAGAEPEGTWDVRITNPTPADCHSEESVQLELWAAPTLTSVVETLACGEQIDTTFLLTGEGFLVVSGVHPTVAIGSFLAEADSVSGCVDTGSVWVDQECTDLTVTVPAGSLEEGLQAVSVTNPDTTGCSTTEAVFVEVVAPPFVVEFVPPSVCYEAPDDVPVEVVGSDFLVLEDGTMPEVRIGDQVFTPDASGGCTALEGPSGGEVCSTLLITVPVGTWTTAESMSTEVRNPEPAACVSNTDVPFESTPPPTITGVSPDELCDYGLTVTLTGTDFIETPSVTFNGIPAASVTFVDSTTLEVTLPEDIGAGVFDIEVVNPDGCADTLEDGLEIFAEPLVLYVDPEVIYSGISVQATVYVSGVNQEVVDVSIEEAADGTTTTLEFLWSGDDPDEILAVVPSALDEGFFHLTVEDAVGCHPTLEEAFYEEDDLTVDLESVDPPFAYTGDYTAVEVYAADPAATGYTQFQDTPRLYLNPATPTADTTATELYAVTYEQATLLDAIVPSGLDVDTYDLLVLNPDGSVGLLEDAVEVMADPIPRIDTVSPGSVDTQDDHDVTLYGAHFDVAGVEFECQDKSTGDTFTASGTVTSSSDTEVVVTIPSATDVQFGNGVVCAVVLTNQNGAYVSYSAVSVTNPSANLYSIEVGTDMTTGRRAPAAVAARATPSARYLYAIGGDDGSSAGALDSVEYATVDKFGDLGEWTELPETLDAPLTLAGVARVGRFVYLVGGNDGSGAVDTLLRAQVLDPLEAPRIDDIEVDYSESDDGLMGGTWIYRVAALFDDTYDDNPGGESLPSDPFVMRLPDLDPMLYVTIGWTEVEGASGYRIYRSPEPDAGSGAEEWVVDVSSGSTISWQDTGLTTDPTVLPLPKASLGRWESLDPMGSAREGACVGVGQDPTDSSTWYLFAAGGRDASGVVLDTVEVFDFIVVEEHDHEGGSWTTSAYALDVPRWQCAGWSVTSDLHPNVALGETWFYVGAGLTTGGSVDTTTEAWLVGSGDFEDYQAVDAMRSRAGYGYGAASNTLYTFGGAGGDPDASTDSALICAVGTGGCAGGPPELKNWNALGLSLNESRYLPGSAQESSVFFIVGGETSTDAASTSVDWANY